ncbi:MAG TPA: helix-turn-helix transcriptional regulator [Crocinitomicaceae bacterium]|nr:helix-turn-helix transcriptional regulator [Crocinitomicaceae bacterium]
MTNQELGDNVRKIRELKGFSQQNLADEIGVDQKTVSRIEQGALSPRFDLVVSIARAFNIKLSALLNFDKELIFNNIVNTQQGGHFIAYNNTEIEKVEELYKQLLKEKDEVIALLRK